MAKRVWIEHAQLKKLSFKQFGQPQVENAIRSRVTDEQGEECYDIEWHGALFHPNGGSKNYLVFDGFQISFSREIPEEARIEGHMLVRVPSLVSGVQSVQYYSALGQRAATDNLQQELLTYIDVNFDIALARTPLPSFVAAPCTTLEERGAPTPMRLNQILNCFNATGERIFINRVVESQPQLGNENAQAGRWHWQLFGRRYCGIIPIDFHTVIYEAGDPGKNATTRIETSVMGTVDNVTVGEIEKTRDKVESILRGALRSDDPLENDHD
jgi:hypothetical protein